MQIDYQWIKHHASPTHSTSMLAPIGSARDPQNHLELLDQYSSAIPALVPSTYPHLLRPSLWHSDLHGGNIFLSKEALAKGEIEITSVIDWQNLPIKPLYVAATIPRLLRYRNQYALPPGPRLMDLPEDIESLPKDERRAIEDDVFDANLQKMYEAYTAQYTTDALNLPHRRLILDAIRFSTGTWDNRFIPVRRSFPPH